MTRNDKNASEPGEKRSPWRAFHSQPVMLSLVLLLLVYLAFVLAESFGIEGEGGWLGETIAATLMVAGVIVIAFVVVGAILYLRQKLGRRKPSTWEKLIEDEED